MIRSDSEPWLLPMRIATPSSFARRTSGEKVSWIRASSASYSACVYSRTANRFLSAKFPGLTRIFSTCSTAFIATAGVKWMSATSGTVIFIAFMACRMLTRLSASAFVGTVTRTISQPASTRRAICETVAVVSVVAGVVID
jgi:hypothetical protein